MRKTLIAAAIMAAVSAPAQALVGAKAGYNYWMTSNHSNVHNLYAQVEHFIPLVPNAGLRYSDVDGGRMEFNSIDAYGYYSLFDNRNIALDLGFGLRRFADGKKNDQSFSSTVPMLNAEFVLFQDSDVAYYAKFDGGRRSSVNFQDFEGGVRFNLMAGLRLQAGYRYYNLELDDLKGIDTEERLKGFNVGAHWQF